MLFQHCCNTMPEPPGNEIYHLTAPVSTMHKKNHAAEILRTMQLAMPVVIGMVASFSMNFVDTLMAGRLPDKEIALAAIATGGAVWSAVLMFILGVLMALQPV